MGGAHRLIVIGMRGIIAPKIARPHWRGPGVGRSHPIRTVVQRHDFMGAHGRCAVTFSLQGLQATVAQNTGIKAPEKPHAAGC